MCIRTIPTAGALVSGKQKYPRYSGRYRRITSIDAAILGNEVYRRDAAGNLSPLTRSNVTWRRSPQVTPAADHAGTRHGPVPSTNIAAGSSSPMPSVTALRQTVITTISTAINRSAMHLAQPIIGLFQYSADDKAYDITIDSGLHMQIGIGPMVRGGAIKPKLPEIQTQPLSARDTDCDPPTTK